MCHEPKCCDPIKLQDSLECNISKKKWMMKFIFLHAGKHQRFLLADNIIVGVVARYTLSTQNKFGYLCNISKKIWRMKLSFYQQINTNVFQKMIVSLCVCVAKLAQNIQNNMFAIYLQNLTENAKDEVDFLPANKHQRFLQNDIIILGVCGKSCPNYPK